VSGSRDSHDVLNSGRLELYCYRTQLGRGIEASTPQNPQEPDLFKSFIIQQRPKHVRMPISLYAL